MSVRFKISMLCSIATALVVIVSCFILFQFVRAKRINDLKQYSSCLTQQIASAEVTQSYLNNRAYTPKEEPIQAYLQQILNSNPFVQELTLSSRFGIAHFTLKRDQRNPEEKKASGSALSLNEVLAANAPIFVEKNWEYYDSLRAPQDETGKVIGYLRIQWGPEATWRYFQFLKKEIGYTAGVFFLLSFFIAHFILYRMYAKENSYFLEMIRLFSSSNYSQRIDVRSLSHGFSDIGVHLNRIFSSIEEEMNRHAHLKDSLREAERNLTEARNALSKTRAEYNDLHKLIRSSLINLFEIVWSGVVLIDGQYQIHYINKRAERLLRFAQFDKDCILDERLRRCLTPLVKFHSVECVDDLCVWPQPALGHSVSCQIRAVSIPVGDGFFYYLVLVREESGFPKFHGSSYFSERLVIDILAKETPSPVLTLLKGETKESAIGSGLEYRFRECLRRIERFREIERGFAGSVKTFRLAAWLKDHFRADDLFSEHLNVMSSGPNVEVMIKVPERLLVELVDNTVELIVRIGYQINDRIRTPISLHASIDSRGAPVLSFDMPHFTRKEASFLHDLLEERIGFGYEKQNNDRLSFEELERDIIVSIYRFVKRLLQVNVECVFSESKKMATILMVIENHTFPDESTNLEAESPSTESVRNLVRDFLSGINSHFLI